MRWRLAGGASSADPFRQDPGYPILSEVFPAAAKRLGFSFSRQMRSSNTPLIAYTIDQRFYHSETSPFPILQIGPGIFACNQSSEYDWPSFKKLCINGISIIAKHYPIFKANKFVIFHCELRYIDAFDDRYTSDFNLMKFLDQNTNFSVSIPDFLSSKNFESISGMTVMASVPIKHHKNKKLDIQIGNAEVGKKTAIIMNSKIVSSSNEGVFVGGINRNIEKIKQWLDDSHEITHRLFESSIKTDLMDKFKGPSNA